MADVNKFSFKNFHTCPVCLKLFASKYNVQRHVKRKHPTGGHCEERNPLIKRFTVDLSGAGCDISQAQHQDNDATSRSGHFDYAYEADDDDDQWVGATSGSPNPSNSVAVSFGTEKEVGPDDSIDFHDDLVHRSELGLSSDSLDKFITHDSSGSNAQDTFAELESLLAQSVSSLQLRDKAMDQHIGRTEVECGFNNDEEELFELLSDSESDEDNDEEFSKEDDLGDDEWLFDGSATHSSLSVKDHAAAVMGFTVRHNCSQQEVNDLLKLIEIHLPNENRAIKKFSVVKSILGDSEKANAIEYCEKCCQIWPEDTNEFRCSIHGCDG